MCFTSSRPFSPKNRKIVVCLLLIATIGAGRFFDVWLFNRVRRTWRQRDIGNKISQSLTKVALSRYLRWNRLSLIFSPAMGHHWNCRPKTFTWVAFRLELFQKNFKLCPSGKCILNVYWNIVKVIFSKISTQRQILMRWRTCNDPALVVKKLGCHAGLSYSLNQGWGAVGRDFSCGCAIER